MLRIPCKKYYAEHLGADRAKCCSRLRAAHSLIINSSEALRFCNKKSENVGSGMFANALCFQGFGFWRPEMFFSKQVSLNNSRSASRIPCKKTLRGASRRRRREMLISPTHECLVASSRFTIRLKLPSDHHHFVRGSHGCA